MPLDYFFLVWSVQVLNRNSTDNPNTQEREEIWHTKTEPPQLYSYFKRKNRHLHFKSLFTQKKSVEIAVFCAAFYSVLFFFIILFFLFDGRLLRPYIVPSPGARLLCLSSCILSFIISAPVSCITAVHGDETIAKKFSKNNSRKEEQKNSPKERKKWNARTKNDGSQFCRRLFSTAKFIQASFILSLWSENEILKLQRIDLSGSWNRKYLVC